MNRNAIVSLIDTTMGIIIFATFLTGPLKFTMVLRLTGLEAVVLRIYAWTILYPE